MPGLTEYKFHWLPIIGDSVIIPDDAVILGFGDSGEPGIDILIPVKGEDDGECNGSQA